MLERIVTKIGISSAGVALGLITILPNFMMCDSGTPLANCTADIGMGASASFVAGGLAAMIPKNPKPQFLLPGLVLQVSMFVVPNYLVKMGIIESDEKFWERERMKDRQRRQS